MRKQSAFLLSIALAAFSSYAGEFDGAGMVDSEVASGVEKKSGSSGRVISVKSKNYNFELSMGPRAGLGLGIMNDGDGLSLSDGAGFGFDIGLGFNARFGGERNGRALNGQGLFGVGVELNYAYASLPTTGDKSLGLGYFEVPVLFQFYPAFSSKQLKNLYIELGPTFCALTNKSPESLNVGNYFYNTGDLKGGDVKGTIGLGYRFDRTSANDGFYLNFRYNIGFSKLAGNFPAKTSTAEITFGYLFKIAGGKKKSASPIKK